MANLDDPQRALYGCADPAFIITVEEIIEEIDAHFVRPPDMGPDDVLLLVDGCIVYGNPATGIFYGQSHTPFWTRCDWFEKEFAAGLRPIEP